MELYLCQQYNVKHYYITSQFHRENALARLLNAFIEALNENKKTLPRLIIFMPDSEFLQMLNYYDYGVSLMIRKCLHWLITQIDRLITIRKDALWHRKPGAVLELEPKVIWVKMLVFPSSRMDIVHAKFNVILEQSLLQAQSGFIMNTTEDDSRVQHSLFDGNGNMTNSSRITFWHFFNLMIWKFDNPDVDLLPQSQNLNQNFNNDNIRRTNHRGMQQILHSLDLKTSYHQIQHNF